MHDSEFTDKNIFIVPESLRPPLTLFSRHLQSIVKVALIITVCIESLQFLSTAFELLSDLFRVIEINNERLVGRNTYDVLGHTLNPPTTPQKPLSSS